MKYQKMAFLSDLLMLLKPSGELGTDSFVIKRIEIVIFVAKCLFMSAFPCILVISLLASRLDAPVEHALPSLAHEPTAWGQDECMFAF
jgi:hypothetical protein